MDKLLITNMDSTDAFAWNYLADDSEDDFHLIMWNAVAEMLLADVDEDDDSVIHFR